MWLLMVLGCLVIVAAKAYCLFWHPEWTETLALAKLWWVWLIAVFLIGGPAIYYKGRE